MENSSLSIVIFDDKNVVIMSPHLARRDLGRNLAKLTPACAKNCGRKQVSLTEGWGKNRICGQNIDPWGDKFSKKIIFLGEGHGN